MIRHCSSITIRVISSSSMLAICGLNTQHGVAQSACPDWSPRFDQVDDADLLQGVRSMKAKGWATVIQQGVAQGMGVQQQIDAFEQTLQQMRAAAVRDQQIWNQIGVPPKPRANAQICKSRPATLLLLWSALSTFRKTEFSRHRALSVPEAASAGLDSALVHESPLHDPALGACPRNALLR